MPLTASKLRADVYRILDQVLETGVPVEIERRGRMLQIVPVEAPSKLENLAPRPYLAVDPEELVAVDWSATWDAERAADPDAHSDRGGVDRGGVDRGGENEPG